MSAAAPIKLAIDLARARIAMHSEPAADAHRAVTDAAAFRQGFERERFAVLRRALPPALCAEAVDGFLEEVHLDTRALFLRAEPDRYARHAYTDTGRMRFPIVNLQDISGRRYPQFKAAGLALLTDAALTQAVQILLGEPARLLRTMYADGSVAAPMPCAHTGAVVGAWIAAEDPDRLGAPALRQGDVLLWDATAGLPAAVATLRQRCFIGHYSGRAPPPPPGGQGGQRAAQHRCAPVHLAARPLAASIRGQKNHFQQFASGLYSPIAFYHPGIPSCSSTSSCLSPCWAPSPPPAPTKASGSRTSCRN